MVHRAGFEPGMYSWWNAIPCGLERPLTAQDKRAGHRFLMRALALHSDLHVVIAVGAVAREVVSVTRPGIMVMTSRSPLRTSRVDRERIREVFERARLDAYPLGLDRDL